MKSAVENKNVIIYGGGGAKGGAVAEGFAKEGARLFLLRRTRENLEGVARGGQGRGWISQASLVGGVEPGALGGAPSARDAPGARLGLLGGATDEEEAGALLGELLDDRAAYCPSPAVDDDVLVLYSGFHCC